MCYFRLRYQLYSKMKDILSEEDYKQILQRRFNTKNIQFVSAEVSSLDNVEGFMGEHYFLKIKYKLNNEESTVKFFIKTTPTKNKVQKDIAIDFNVFEKEIFVYDYLFEEYKKLGYSNDFAPKCYYSKSKETLVMDDLKLEGFELFDRNQFYDVNHCQAALKSLANYHANAIAYEETKSKELGRPFKLNEGNDVFFQEIFWILNDVDGAGIKFINKTIECYVAVTKIMPETQEWREIFKERAGKLNLAEIFWTPLPYRKTCGHGDLWSNNMMFKYSSGIPVHCCLLDFQLVRYHHPAYDAILILYSNTSRSFRKKNMKKLLDYYYDIFEDILAKYGYIASSILPREDFLKAAEALKIVALFQGASTRTLTRLPKEITSKAVNSSDGNDLEDLWFEDERARIILDGCSKDDNFRSVIFDDIYDLNECLEELNKK